MVFGPAEAFTPEQLAGLYDINVLSTEGSNIPTDRRIPLWWYRDMNRRASSSSEVVRLYRPHIGSILNHILRSI